MSAIRFTCLILLLLLSGGCAAPPISPEPLDLREMPQEASAYLDAEDRGKKLLTSPDRISADYLKRYFAPWEGMEARPARKAFWFEEWLVGKRVFGENLRPLDSRALRNLLESADRESYPSLDLPAITVRPAECRALPTRRPIFLDPSRAGEGFPFDYLQNSALPANTPLRIRHRSRDGAWVYAETATLYGWFPAGEVAVVDEDLIRSVRALPWLAVIEEETSVFDAAGGFLHSSRIGALYPLSRQEDGNYRVLTAFAAPDGSALLREALLPAEGAAPFPIEATPERLAALADRMLGQPYGWGDLYGRRDCSSTLRDLFAPFGLWLPRNSSRQAEAGQFIDLQETAPGEKEGILLERGVPWRTLVWMDGHIMLYIGEFRGRAAVLHTLWGLRTRDREGREGRRIVGRTVITTLQPGVEYPDLARPDGDLLNRVRGMTLLGEESPVEALTFSRTRLNASH